MSKVEKLVIIGSGPAGLTAAIYAARGNLNPLVIAGREAGGQLMLTTDVDDFPGFPQGIQGPQLMKLLREQAERFETRFVDEDVTAVNFKKTPLEIQTETQAILTQVVIVATGASAQWLGLPSEQKLIGRGVSSCAVCDAPFFKDKDVALVGGGDTAMREAQHLAKLVKSVTIIHRRDTLRAQPALVEIVKAKRNVKFIFKSVVEEILGEEKVSGVRIKDVVSGKVTDLAVEGVFVAIGHTPNTEFLKGQLDLDEKGYIAVADGSKTSLPAVLVAGDAADFRYRQAVTAAGAGCKAALDAEEYLAQLQLPTNGN